MVNKVTTDFVTAAHLTEVKRQYYELDLLNEYSGERYVFMIPKDIFNVTIINRRVIKPQVEKLSERNKRNNNPQHMIT